MLKRGILLIDIVLLVAILLGLFYSSSQPYEKQDVRGSINNYVNTEKLQKQLGGIVFEYGGKEISIKHNGVAGFVEFFIRKAAHFTTFAVLTLMFYRVLRHFVSATTAFPWSGLLTVVVAMLDEWHQTFTPNRTSMLTDVLLDTTGVFVMFLLIAVWNIYFRKRPRKYLRVK